MPELLPLLFLPALLLGQPAANNAPAAPVIPPELQDVWQQYEQLTEEHPHQPALHYNFGNLAYGISDYQKALAEYHAALGSGDRSSLSKVHYNLGNSLFRAGQVDESRSFFRKALELNPADQDARINYELATLLAQQQQEAEQSQSPARQPDAEKDSPNDPGEGSPQDRSEEQNDRAESGRQPEAGAEQQAQQDQAEAQPGEPDSREQTRAGEELEREEAEAILNALRANADNLLKRTYGPPAAAFKLEKDW